jgi:fructoselysine-6-P-deglycase FrlB-like protein
MTKYAQEVRSQPATWTHAVDRIAQFQDALPEHGTRLIVAGCGTSYYVAGAYAALRETSGHGETDAFAASQAPRNRRYDEALAISRSGTTSEVVDWLGTQPMGRRTCAIVGKGAEPVAAAARSCAVLDFADEASLVQTRFATTALALLRAHLGDDVRTLARDAEALLTAGAPLGDVQYEHFVFLGEGFGAALAHEAALKMRETAGAWTEAYAAPEYRHGPVSAAAEQTLVWALGPVGDDVLEHAERTGAHVRASDRDPMVELVAVHLQAELEARRRGRDIDNPPFLSRSVVLG